MSNPSRCPPNIKIAVVIATKNRSELLARRALTSITNQTRKPDLIIIVDDSDSEVRQKNKDIIEDICLPKTSIIYKENDRTAGACGAWNVALDNLHRDEDPARIFIAILDDDDSWLPQYLEKCEHHICTADLDMIAADIIRIEQIGKHEVVQQAPNSLRINDFLVGNPGIQGSNLFVRLGVMLEAGLFDEELKSATDRDLCIRIGELGDVRYSRLPEPLVKHYADGRERLSTPGSDSKLKGLTSFYRKYKDRMTIAQQNAFKERAKRLFHWHSDYALKIFNKTASHSSNDSSDKPSVTLIVGIISGDPLSKNSKGLIYDLCRLLDDPRLGGLDVVILENSQNGVSDNHLIEARTILLEAGVGCYIVPLERQKKDASSGMFGESFKRPVGRVSIAKARTMLQTYTYRLAKPRTGAIVWIIDGDCRLNNLCWDGSNVTEQSQDIIGTLIRLRNTDIDIAIGTVSDAPPVPFASCIRNQIVDLNYNLAVMARSKPYDKFHEYQQSNMELRSLFDDYYYDLSRSVTNQLETPFGYAPKKRGYTVRESFLEMTERLPRIFAGEQVFRPIILDKHLDPMQHLEPSVHRGGNTFIFDIEALADFPNAAPKFRDTNTRRSDMIWSLLNSKVANRRVEKLPLAVRQDRGSESVNSLDLGKLAADIQGYAFYSALQDVLEIESTMDPINGNTIVSIINRIDIDFLVNRTHKYLRERLAAFSLSFYRVIGLSKALRKYIDNSPNQTLWWISDESCTIGTKALCKFIQMLNREYDVTRLNAFKRSTYDFNSGTAKAFLDNLLLDIDARNKAKPKWNDVDQWLEEQRIIIARYRLEREYKLESLKYLGLGSEAVVFTDGRLVYKCLDYWKCRLPQKQLEFLRENLGQWKEVSGLHSLHSVQSHGAWSVITYEYKPSNSYCGGHGPSVISLLRSCKKVGIVCSNIHPQNLVVADEEVKLIDYGADIQPFNDEKFEHMARRAYLSWCYPDRPDLKQLMREALTDSNMPELEGFDLFRKAVEPTSKELLLDHSVSELLGNGNGNFLLDYGCGKGKLARTLASNSWVVTAFDPNTSLNGRWQSADYVQFGNHSLLLSLRQEKKKFSTVICNLVLCIVNDKMVTEIFDDLDYFTETNGTLIISICNPRFIKGTTQLQHRFPPECVNENDNFQLVKKVFSNNAEIIDIHRPMSWYRNLFKKRGFVVERTIETPAIDMETFTEDSDFIVFLLKRRTQQKGNCNG